MASRGSKDDGSALSDTLATPSSPSSGLDDTVESGRFDRTATADPRETHPAGVEQLPEMSGARYQMSDELGRGGLGRVLRARDRVLQRAVAVKELHGEEASSRERFVREALITARLQHPSIVPVYEAGRWKSGAPFYAMQLVRGRPFADVIAAAKSLDQRLALLPNVIAISDAIAYAHSEDVIHRDLKPSNVMIGEFGETTVIDWGLAKDLGSDDVEASGGRGAASLGETVDGAVLGTPAYMAPEQARGGAVDARTDVYALGAMLYHVLAGEMPHQGTTVEEVLRKVKSGDVEPLARRTPGAPAELVTIVEKAMALDPARRYPSARELAEDLRRFQTGQLVGAHRYSLWQLAARTVRRHRGAFAVGAVLLAILAVTSTISVRTIMAERRSAQRERAAAEHLVDHMLSDLHDRLLAVGRLDAMEGSMEEVEAYFAGFGDSRRGDRDLERHARTLEILGDVRRASGDLDAALAATQAAADLDEELARRRPGDVRLAIAAALSQGAISKLLSDRGDLAGAERAVLTEVDAMRALDRAHPDEPRILDNLAVALEDQAQILQHQAQIELAIAAQREAIGLLDALSRRDHAEDTARQLANAHLALGDLLLPTDPAAALVEIQLSVTERDRRVRTAPDDTRAAADRVEAHRFLGDAQLALGRLTEAQATFEDALVAAKRLIELEPANDGWRSELAALHLRRGNVRAERGDVAGAIESYRDAAREYDRLVAGDPRHIDWRISTSNLHSKLGHWLDIAGRPDDALASLERSRAVTDALRHDHPDDARVLDYQAQLDEEFGLHWAAGGDHARAAESFRRAIAAREGKPEARRHLAINQQELMYELDAGGDRDGARVAGDAALTTMRALLAAQPDNPAYQRDLYTQLVGMVFIDPPSAATLLREALPLAESLAAGSPESNDAQGELAYTLFSVAELELGSPTARSQIERGIEILERLERAGTLSADQKDWLAGGRDLLEKAGKK